MSNATTTNSNHGIGAIASVRKKFLHPSKAVNDRYPNMVGATQVVGLKEVRKEQKNVNRRLQWCIIFKHDDFPDTELHAVERWVMVTVAAASTFEDKSNASVGDDGEAAGAVFENQRPGDTINHMHVYLKEGFLVDNDTEQN